MLCLYAKNIYILSHLYIQAFKYHILRFLYVLRHAWGPIQAQNEPTMNLQMRTKASQDGARSGPMGPKGLAGPMFYSRCADKGHGPGMGQECAHNGPKGPTWGVSCQKTKTLPTGRLNSTQLGCQLRLSPELWGLPASDAPTRSLQTITFQNMITAHQIAMLYLGTQLRLERAPRNGLPNTTSQRRLA